MAQVRQLAAVELRKRISQHSGDLWVQCSVSERDQIKAKLPELILAEPKYVATTAHFTSPSHMSRLQQPRSTLICTRRCGHCKYRGPQWTMERAAAVLGANMHITERRTS